MVALTRPLHLSYVLLVYVPHVARFRIPRLKSDSKQGNGRHALLIIRVRKRTAEVLRIQRKATYVRNEQIRGTEQSYTVVHAPCELSQPRKYRAGIRTWCSSEASKAAMSSWPLGLCGRDGIWIMLRVLGDSVVKG